jgi:hypothetical protein
MRRGGIEVPEGARICNSVWLIGNHHERRSMYGLFGEKFDGGYLYRRFRVLHKVRIVNSGPRQVGGNTGQSGARQEASC